MVKKLIAAFLLITLGLSIGIAWIKRSEIKKFAVSLRKHEHTRKFENHSPSSEDVWGIDISHHQKSVNWNEIAKRKPDFIFLKATEGTTHTDTRYYSYKKATEDLGIPTGAYHFFSYQSDGAKQARHFIKTAKLSPGDLLPVLDCEFKRNMPPKRQVTRELLAFIDEIEDVFGAKPIIYCECSYYNAYLKRHLSGEYPLWISNFRKEPPCGYVFWQKTDKFKHAAFGGTVDFNAFNGALQDLENYTMR